MSPQFSAFALGLLLGAAKLGAVGALGFGIAWWRASRKLRRLELSTSHPSLLEQRLDRLEQSNDYLASQLDRLVVGQAELGRQLMSPDARSLGALQPAPVDPPATEPPKVITPH